MKVLHLDFSRLGFGGSFLGCFGVFLIVVVGLGFFVGLIVPTIKDSGLNVFCFSLLITWQYTVAHRFHLLHDYCFYFNSLLHTLIEVHMCIIFIYI